MSAKETESTTAATAPMRDESSSTTTGVRATTTAGLTGGGGGGASNVRHPQQASSSSRQRPLQYSPKTPPPHQPLPGAYDSDRSNDRDKYVVLPDLFPAEYTLEWGSHMPCTRTPLDIDAVTGSATVGDNALLRVNALRHAWKCEQDSLAPPPPPAAGIAARSSSSRELAAPHRLFVLRDTSDDDTNRIVCSALDVDPAFLEAHITGQRYRPRDRPWRGPGKSATFSASTYTYPQVLTLLVSKSREATPIDDNEGRVQQDGPGTGLPTSIFDSTTQLGGHGEARQRQRNDEKTPEVATASATAVDAKSPGSTPLPWPPSAKDDVNDNPVVMFCRASLWMSPRANVLLLDRSPSSTTLEDALLDALDDTATPDSAMDPATVVDALDNAVVGLAYDQWVEFFDTLGSSNREASYGKSNKKLFLEMSHCLEQNLIASRAHEKRLYHKQQQRQSRQGQDAARSQPHGADSYSEPHFTSSDDWRALLSRLERVVALLPLQRRKSPAAPARRNSTRFTTPDTTFAVDRIASDDIDGLTTRNQQEIGLSSGDPDSSAPVVGAIPALAHQPFSQTPEGQSALSRITYMGGILLPFSIIASVLSMSDPFGPGERLFWVFWVITLPITCFTLTIIYADDIRKAYIWKPMSHKSFQEAIKRGEAIPAEAAAALANAAGTVIDKFMSDSDPEIETEPVTAAVRPSDSGGGDRRRARVRVTTDSGPGGPTFYRLSEPPQPGTENPPVHTVPGPRPPSAGDLAAAVDDGNVQVMAVMSARRQRRFGIPNLAPFARRPRVSAQNPSHPVFSGAEAGLPYAETALPHDEAVVIDMTRANTNSGVAEMIGRPVAGPNLGRPGCPAIYLEQRPDGSEGTAWRRQQLGWAGAVKSIVGYQKPQKA